MDYCVSTKTANQYEAEAPVETMRVKIDRIVETVREMYEAIEDTGIALFGTPINPTEARGKEPEIDCMNTAIDFIDGHARIVLNSLLRIRSRML